VDAIPSSESGYKARRVIITMSVEAVGRWRSPEPADWHV